VRWLPVHACGGTAPAAIQDRSIVTSTPSAISTPAVDKAGRCTIGVVAIGRNEGARLKRCLESVQGAVNDVVYVDSGSTDDSVAMSHALGVAVVELDLRQPFTAARARNAGFGRLLQLQPALDYVFFVDGDCEVVDGWLERAGRYLDEHPDFAVVWGMRRERFPEKSVYNLLCDVEWQDYATGETRVCGGDALIRADAFRQVEGYRPDLICGEEPEMCIRLRAAGWRIWHLPDAMTLHDAAMYRFSQWWKRMKRTGYAFAQAVQLHGAAPERQGVVESRRAWFWGFFLPLLALAMTAWFGPAALLILLAYPLQISRIALSGKYCRRTNWWRAAALIAGKFPEVHGQLQFLADRLRRTQSRLIEYK
jgi:GT2 family glycosyltransferase